MRISIAVLVAVLFVGCTSMKPVDMTPEELQRVVLSGEVLEPGKKARIVTKDETQHKIKVVSVSETHVVGEDVSIPIEDIVGVHTKKFSAGKTLALAVTASAILYTAAAVSVLAAL